jgi:hypothetical protein
VDHQEILLGFELDLDFTKLGLIIVFEADTELECLLELQLVEPVDGCAAVSNVIGH